MARPRPSKPRRPRESAIRIARLRRVRAVLLSLLAGVAPPAQAASIFDPGQGFLLLASDEAGARDLSGLTWRGGQTWYAVSDKGGALYPLTAAVDLKTGRLGTPSLGTAIALHGARDLEGIAWHPGSETLLVVDEVGSLREYRLDGSRLRSIPLPEIFRRARRNTSLESLARHPEDGSLWVANEEALRVDGPTSGLEHGTWVRLQHLDADGAALGQWAYRTEAIPGTRIPDAGTARSGLVELAVLPGGELLALERSHGLRGFQTRIYQVHTRSASDVSERASLADGAFEPVSKTLLWEATHMRFFNFEGMAVGPRLADGAHALVLISDNGGYDFAQVLYPLTVRPATPRGTLQTRR